MVLSVRLKLLMSYLKLENLNTNIKKWLLKGDSSSTAVVENISSKKNFSIDDATNIVVWEQNWTPKFEILEILFVGSICNFNGGQKHASTVVLSDVVNIIKSYQMSNIQKLKVFVR